MHLSKGDLVYQIRIEGVILKDAVGIVLRPPYEDIFQISKNPPIRECVLVVDLLINKQIYYKIPIKNIKKVGKK